jgi:hypothetical protein
MNFWKQFTSRPAIFDELFFNLTFRDEQNERLLDVAGLINWKITMKWNFKLIAATSRYAGVFAK